MTETRKEVKTCHDCGLEAIDACETENKHIPYGENSAPCCFCVRNRNKPKASVITDFYSETWTLDIDKTPIMEDPDPHERELLDILREAVKGGERLAEIR